MEARSKHVDTAVTCLLDFARGAVRVQDGSGDPLMYAVDIAHDLKASFDTDGYNFNVSFLWLRGTW